MISSFSSFAMPFGGGADGVVQRGPLVELQFVGGAADVWDIALRGLAGNGLFGDGDRTVFAKGVGHGGGGFGDGQRLA